MSDIRNNHLTLATGLKSVADFRSPRSWLAAVGFYFFHLTVMLSLCALAGIIMTMLMGTVDQAEAYQIGFKAGQVTAFLYSTALFILIISAKKLWSNPWYILALIGTLLLSVLGGGIGLIVSAIVLGLKPGQKATN